MRPAITAPLVARTWPLGASPIACRTFGHRAVVGEDRLPGDGPDQVGGEERRDHREQHHVPPSPRLEGDRVGERVGDQQREQRRRPGVLEGADELRVVERQRVAVVRPVPAEFEAADDARLERQFAPCSTAGRRRRGPARSSPARAGSRGRGGGGGGISAIAAVTVSAVEHRVERPDHVLFLFAFEGRRRRAVLRERRAREDQLVLRQFRIAAFARISLTPSTGVT